MGQRGGWNEGEMVSACTEGNSGDERYVHGLAARVLDTGDEIE